ncbi:MAG TPA: ABC transporter permease [Pyrinomonadaceae bacterium]|nr:ABC transporter permease [Pyrinomonadaceae bacterium]
MEGLLKDIRYSIRGLRKRPGFTLLVVLVLAFAIAANSSIFSIVNAVILKPLSFQDPDQLVWIWATRKNVNRAFFSIPNFIDTRDQNQTLAEVAPLAIWPANLTGQGEAERLPGVRISANALQMLGVQATAGRALVPEDDNPNSARVVMLSYSLWQRRFGGTSEALGKTLTLNGDPYTVIGILPPRFVIPNAETEIMVPLRMDQDPRRTERGSNFLRVLARLKPGVTPAQAQVDLTAISNRLRDLYPDHNGNVTPPRVLALQDEVVGSYREGLWLILTAVVMVLLIACANLASFQLARAASRHKEMAIRAALGARRLVLMRQLITESMLLATLGGGLGLLLSFWAKDLLLTVSPADFPRAAAINIDGRVLLFSLLITLFAGFALGLAPAIQHTKSDLNSDLKEGGRDASGVTRNRVRSLLVVAEIALSLMLLVGAGLLVKSFARLRVVSPGFDASNVLAVRLSLPAARYSSGASVKLFYDQISARISVLPGVERVSAASALPLSGLIARTTFTIAGRPPANASEVPAAQHRWVGPAYFQTMKIPLVRGRDLSDRDSDQSPRVIVIDQALQRRFFGDQEPLGTHVLIDMGDGNPARDYEVVGIVEDVKHMGLTDEPTPTLYGPIPQAPKSAVPFMANNLSLVVRTGVDAEALSASVRKELRNIDADVATAGVRPMGQFLAAAVAARKFNLELLVAFAATALLLAAAGLYAVIAYLVSQRTREIGVRLALGAAPRHILRLMIGQGMKLTAIGVAMGFIGAIAVTRLMSSLLFSVAPTDLVTFAVSAIALTLVAFLACFLPARRATKVDPLVALRYE